MAKLLTPELEAMVGTEVRYEAPEELGRASIRYFARAIGDDNPLYTDAAAARDAGYSDVIAPPTLVCETLQYADLPRRDNGYIGHEWNIEIPDTRMIRGGNDYELFRPAHPSDRLVVTWRLTGMTERMSRDGLAMLIVAAEAQIDNQEGEALAVNRETLIYQELPV